MHFKEKVKEKFIMRCAKCGYASGNGATGSFTSWLFHEQLCSCKEVNPSEPARIGLANTFTYTAELFLDEKPDLGDQYEILGVLGKGGMGTVYKAKDNSDGTIVAIKVLKKELMDDEKISKRFEQEALAVSRLNHPNLVAVKTYGQSPSGAPYFVMEYFEGKNLAELIKERGHLSVAETIQITMQIAEAIDHAHAFSVIHRDIKPSNILLSQEGDQLTVKVVDFGIAKAMRDQQTESGQLTQTGEVFGSPAYMSPEQCLGDALDERSDIYSLGCVMYEMLTGKSPFVSDNPIQTVLKHVNDEPERFEIEYKHLHIPHLVENIVLKCLHKDPAKRYGTVFALEQGLKRLYGAPASVLRRFAAAVVDTLIPSFIVVIFLAQPWFFHQHWLAQPWLPLIVFICYFASLEHWRQGAPFKRILDLRVMDINGNRIGWLKSAIRILTLYSLVWGVWHILWIVQLSMILLHMKHFTPDWINIPLTLTGLLFAGYWFLIALSKNHISPVDRFFGRVVAFPNLVATHRKVTAAPNKLQFGMALIAIFSIVMTTWTYHQLERCAVDRHLATEHPLVYAVKDVPEGTEISADAVEVRMIPEFNTVPEDAFTSVSDVTGKIAKYGIAAGAIVSQHDLNTRHLIYAIKDIQEGTAIPADSLEIRIVPEFQVTDDVVTSIEQVEGKRAKYGIAAGQVVSKHDLALTKTHS